MKTSSRIIIAVAALLLGLNFFCPLWMITLSAPQYPEGLNLSIWTFKLTGDVQTVNILNHYIGMKPITEAGFPELQYFPKIFGAFLALGLIVAAIGKRWGVWAWTSLMIGFSIWAMHDFYQWEADFGHDLNPAAAIKMEDMVYQPPLIGTKTMLNIEAGSYPDIAGYGMIFAVVLGVLVSYLEFKRSRKA